MYDFAADPALPKPELYRELLAAADGLTAGEPDAVANMANVAALLRELVPGLNWAGFYRLQGEVLVLGPFSGKPACIRIPLGRGVCGTAAAAAQSLLVADVHAFPGHIACDSASNSEIVLPLVRDGALLGVLDLDSPKHDRFDEEDEAGLRTVAEILARAL
jgi:L-methionine (R)-S-oxide reductase